MNGKLFYSPPEAARSLSMGLDELEDWMTKGKLKYARHRRKRRIFTEDLEDFARWYSKEYAACPSIGTPKASSGSTTSNVVDFGTAAPSTGWHCRTPKN